MLVSSTEQSPYLRVLGDPSTTPEIFGCDFLARIPSSTVGGRWIAWQRKAINDLIASLHDGRLTVERAQWNRLLELDGIVTLIIEGKIRWSQDNIMLSPSGKPFTRSQFRRLIHSVNRQGVSVQFTDSERDTADLIVDTLAYHTEPRTGSRISPRPGPKGRWGKPTSRDYLVHVMTSFPGVGATYAEAILDHNGGSLPLQWTVRREWFEEVRVQTKKGQRRLPAKVIDGLWEALQPVLSVVKGAG